MHRLGTIACLSISLVTPVVSRGEAILEIISPEGDLRAEVHRDAQGRLSYQLLRDGRFVLERSPLGMALGGADLRNVDPTGDAERFSVESEYAILGGKSLARFRSNQARVSLRSKGIEWTLVVSLSNDALAFRYEAPSLRDARVLADETAFTLPAGSKVWYFERPNAWKLKSYAGHWLSAPIEEMTDVSPTGPVQGAPIVVELPHGGFAALAESSVLGFPGMRYRAVDGRRFVADYPEDEGFQVAGPFVTPWRVIIAARDLNQLVNQTAVQNLAPEPDPQWFADASWIKPGRSVWRWQVRGIGTLEDQTRYVDMAARLGFEYSILDAGWETGKWGDDPWPLVHRLCAYGKQKGVGIFLWKNWNEFCDPADDYAAMRQWMDRARAAGAVGLKVDFINGEDVFRRSGEEAVLREAARHRLLINFHGCVKPTGEARTWPNELTREGVRGLELNFMNGREPPITADHNAALPFTRYILGPADYTPLTFLEERMNGTTLAHQLATCVAFTSPLLCYNAFPERMLNHPTLEIAALLKAIPATWDETRVLPGSEIGKLAILARRKGSDWFIAGLNGLEENACEFDLKDFGCQSATLLRDGTTPSSAVAERFQVSRPFSLELAPCGGFVLWLTQ